LNRPIDHQRHASEQVLHGLLGRERDREPTDAETCEQARHVHAEILREHEEHDRREDDLRDPHRRRNQTRRVGPSADLHADLRTAPHLVEGARAEPDEADGREDDHERSARGMDRNRESQRRKEGEQQTGSGQQSRGRSNPRDQHLRVRKPRPRERGQRALHDSEQHDPHSERPDREGWECDPLPERELEEPLLDEQRREMLLHPGNRREERLERGDRLPGDAPDGAIGGACVADERDGDGAPGDLEGSDVLRAGRESVLDVAPRIVAQRADVDPESAVEHRLQAPGEIGPETLALSRRVRAQIEVARCGLEIAAPTGREKLDHRRTRAFASRGGARHGADRRQRDDDDREHAGASQDR